MTERFRNDLYYIERLRGAPMALYPDGTVAELEEKEIEVGETSTSRRPERRRVVKKMGKHLAQTALYESVSDYLAVHNKRLAKAAKKYQNYDNDKSWSLEDMPDDVIERYEKWKNSLEVPDEGEIVAAAHEMTADDQTALEATVGCPDCRQTENKYACYSCGYARAYYKYPLVRLVSDDGNRDVPFDVAKFIANDPSALTFEVRTKFDYRGEMSAEQVAILHSNKLSGAYTGLDPDDVQIEKADDLNKEMVFTVATWQEKKPKNLDPVKLTPKSPPDLIAAIQDHAAVRVVREQIDMPRDQKVYEEFMEKIKKIGKGTMVVVFRGRYMGMGESEVQMFLSAKPDDPLALQEVWSSSETKWLIDKVNTALDVADSVDGVRTYLHDELMKSVNRRSGNTIIEDES